MATLTHATELHGTEGYAVETADGAIGQVEEIWLGPGEEPQALAIRLNGGSRALLLEGDVVAVDRERGWVVVGPDPELLELDAPRLTAGDGRLAASWTTTGAVVHPEPPSKPGGVLETIRRRTPRTSEWPLWQLVATLYSALAVIVVFIVALVFVVAWIAAGSRPY